MKALREKLHQRENREMEDHDTIIEIRTKVNAIYEKIECMEKKVVYKDYCNSNHNGDEQRMSHIEGDIKDLKDGNNNRTTFIMAGIAIIVAVVIPVVAAIIQYAR